MDSLNTTNKTIPSHATNTEALGRFLCALHNTFGERRWTLLQQRHERSKRLRENPSDESSRLHFLESTRSIRDSNWTVTATPEPLKKRIVEITGPAEPKMIINALNSGADVFMADFEDSLSPSWEAIQKGHAALHAACRGQLRHEVDGKSYELGPSPCTLIVRPRGLHMTEHHFVTEGQSISASLFDFGTFLFENAEVLIAAGKGPYFYIPKLESHWEAKFWADVFEFSENYLGIPAESIKATVLIETAPAAFEMEEILYQLRKYIVGLNAGRWDYLFSWIKKFHHSPDHIFPDRALVHMNVPFMKAYCERIVDVCHRRGAHAMGGMSAFIPNRKEPAITEQALLRVREDKAREVNLGFDGTWVAHPDLIAIAREEFEKVLLQRPNQKERQGRTNIVDAELRDTNVRGGIITEAGVRNNLYVGLVYIDHWIRGVGAVAINNLMEDAATAEISRSQLWQWVKHRVKLSDGLTMEPALVERWLIEEANRAEALGLLRRRSESERAFKELIFNSEFTEFLTLKCEHLLPGGIT